MSRGRSAQLDDIGELVKDFVASRPRRPRYGRKVAGVAAGVANRYAIDPVIVRVAFAVTALFGGAGVLAYLLGWLLLAEESDEVSPFESMIGRGRSATSSAFTVLLCLALIPASSWFFGATWFAGGGFSGFLGAAALLGGLYLLHKNRGHLVRPEPFYDPAPADPWSSAAPTGGTMYDTTGNQPGTSQAVDGPAPSEVPGWDPLGAAPLAWDLPELVRAAPAEPVRGPKPKVTLITFGLAMLVGAVGFWIASIGGIATLEPELVIGLVLAVLGLGLVAGAFVRSGRGLIWPAVGLSVAGLLVSGSGYDGWHGAGDQQYTPATAAAVQPSYQITAGNLDLDLTRLPADAAPVRTTVQSTFGNVRVTVPADADVRAACHARVGQVNCLNRQQDGISPRQETVDYGDDGVGGQKIDLSVITSAGNVEVVRA